MERLNIQLLIFNTKGGNQEIRKDKICVTLQDFVRTKKKKNGRKSSPSLVWYLFKNVIHNGFLNEGDRYIFSKYYGMKEATGHIWY